MIDFTPCTVNKFKGYGGANGNKINIIYMAFNMQKTEVMWTKLWKWSMKKPEQKL